MSYTRIPRQPVIINRVPQISEASQYELNRISNTPIVEAPYKMPQKSKKSKKDNKAVIPKDE